MSRVGGRTGPVVVAHPGAELYGSDRMLIESVAGLVEAGRRVVVVLPSNGPLVRQLELGGATVRVLPMPVLRKAALRPRGFARLLGSVAASIGPSLRLLREVRPSSVYVSTQTIPTWVLAGRLARAHTVCHVHEAERHPSALVEKGLVWPLLACHRVLANSRYSASVIADVAPRLASRTHVVHNGVLGPDRVAGQKRAAPAGRPVRVLFVGRLSPRKGPQVAVRAVRALRERGVPATITLLGNVFPGYEWFERELRRDSADLAAQGAVTFLGFRDSIWEVLDEHDVAVVPSILPEPFGNTAVEAVLAGLPVVVSRAGGLPEAVAGVQSARVVTPDDPDAVAAAIAELVADWTAVARAARAAVAPCAERFSAASYRAAVAQAMASPAAERLSVS